MNREMNEELNALGSRLADLPARNPFQLPQPEYFPGLPAALLQHVSVNLTDDPLLRLSKAMKYEVPDGYLESLPDVLLAEAKTFGAPDKLAPYTVPESYFNGLSEQLLTAARMADGPVPKVKTTAFPVLRRSVPWFAAAAVLAAVWFGLVHSPAGPSADLRAETALAGLNSDSIGAYVERHVDEFDPETLEASLAGTQVTDFRKAVSELQNDEIENYLNDAEAGPGSPDDI